MAQKQLTPIDMNGNAITNLPTTPAGNNDAASKAYVDANTGGGGIAGPGTVTDNSVLRWDGTTGATVQESSVLIGDTGIVTITAPQGVGTGSLVLNPGTNGLFTDKITETTTDAGVTIENVLIKDGLVDGVDVSTLAAASVDPNTLVGDDPTMTFTQTRYGAALVGAANARVGTADIVVIGDSSVEGHGADSWYDRLPLAIGSITGELGYHLVLGNVNTFADKPIAFSGNAGTVAQDGTEGRGWACRNAVLRDTSGKITATFVGDGFDLYYVAYNGGPTIEIKVDGGTPTSLSTSQATTDRFKQWVGPTLAYGPHTVEITRPSGSGYAYVNSLRVFQTDRTQGVRVWDGGHATYTTAAYLAQEAQWGPGITTIQPDVVIVSIGGNDLVDARTPAAATADYVAIVDAIKARCTVEPQIIATMLSRHGSTTLTAWTAMFDAFKAAAATEGWKWIDSRPILPEPDTYGSLYWSDDTHLSSAGQAVHASALSSRLVITPNTSDYHVPNLARVIHGSTASAPRPRAKHVEWVGSVAPTNATASDTWVDTA